MMGMSKYPKKSKNVWKFGDDWWRQEIGRGHQRRPRIDVFLNNWLTLRNQSETKAHGEYAAFGEYVEEKEQDGSGVTIHSIAADIDKLAGIYRDIEIRSPNSIEQFLYRRQVMGIGVIIPGITLAALFRCPWAAAN